MANDPNSLLGQIDPQYYFDQAAGFLGHPLSAADQATLVNTLTNRLGDVNYAWGGGVVGTVMSIGGVILKLFQCLCGFLTGGGAASIGDAFQQSFQTATNDTRYDVIRDALARACIDLKYSGSADLAAVAEHLTGMFDTHGQPQIAIQPPAQNDMSDTLIAANHLTTPVHDGLNLNPSYQPQHIDVIAAPPPTPGNPALTGGYGVA